ncbi:MAG: hypothetical protein JNM17_27200 [Archangium sp.]|nr:hypothetical protein [Archangium sp.]
MFLAAYLTVVCAQLPPPGTRSGENKLTQLEFKSNPQGLTWDWSDAEETVRGTITPSRLKAGNPITISAVLEAVNGEEIMSPVTISIRPAGEMGSADSKTVPRGTTRVWTTSFTPAEAGDYKLEIGWRTTHHKVIRGVFTVNQAGLPEWVTWAFGGGAIVVALAVGLWVLFGRKETDEPPPSGTGSGSGDAPT